MLKKKRTKKSIVQGEWRSWGYKELKPHTEKELKEGNISYGLVNVSVPCEVRLIYGTMRPFQWQKKAYKCSIHIHSCKADKEATMNTWT